MKKSTHPLTLRLSPEIAAAVENRAYERGISQVDWIRRAFRRSFFEKHDDELRKGAATERSEK